MGDQQEIWNEDAFRSVIKQIVSRISRIGTEELDDRVLIREELGIDSLMAMEIVATCEKTFNIRIDETRVARVETVGEFLDLLISLSKEKAA